jgi:hypothetical protein
MNICVITFYSIAFLEKIPNLGKFSKIIPFSEEFTTKLPLFHDFTKIVMKIVFFNSKHSKQYKEYQKSFDMILKFVKKYKFLD